MLEATLVKRGYDFVVACHGDEARQALQQENALKLVLLDWMVPGMDGPDVCRKVRERATEPYVYMILLTAKTQKEEIISFEQVVDVDVHHVGHGVERIVWNERFETWSRIIARVTCPLEFSIRRRSGCRRVRPENGGKKTLGAPFLAAELKLE